MAVKLLQFLRILVFSPLTGHVDDNIVSQKSVVDNSKQSPGLKNEQKLFYIESKCYEIITRTHSPVIDFLVCHKMLQLHKV